MHFFSKYVKNKINVLHMHTGMHMFAVANPNSAENLTVPLFLNHSAVT